MFRIFKNCRFCHPPAAIIEYDFNDRGVREVIYEFDEIIVVDNGTMMALWTSSTNCLRS